MASHAPKVHSFQKGAGHSKWISNQMDLKNSDSMKDVSLPMAVVTGSAGISKASSYLHAWAVCKLVF